ncbi:hypothetical protein C5167_015438 [Papaver somniferum]|uniref:Uncharacterized protein n=1 Tax=Papaver somniferum TaxID=3469 RepID=A0A4Y7JA34_PAPSO|nr:hypothetical protein C5167_015438 [Papaver somniferum]
MAIGGKNPKNSNSRFKLKSEEAIMVNRHFSAPTNFDSSSNDWMVVPLLWNKGLMEVFSALKHMYRVRMNFVYIHSNYVSTVHHAVEANFKEGTSSH